MKKRYIQSNVKHKLLYDSESVYNTKKKMRKFKLSYTATHLVNGLYR